MSIISPMFLLFLVLSLTYTIVSDCDSCYMNQYIKQSDQKFDQKNKRFWEFNEKSNTWVEVKLPYDLVSCINDNCTVVNSIQESRKKTEDHVSEQRDILEKKDDDEEGQDKSFYEVLPVRKRISLTKMSETSIWITGESGSIYERFWNGWQWVIAPHDLPVSAGYAVSVFIVNQTILALSESGLLYQMQLTEDSQPVWIEFMPEFDKGTSKETIQTSEIQLSSGVLSNDRERIYFCTKNGLLLELLGVDPPRWENHGRPPGANVAVVADAATIRPGLLFTISGAGDLYEYDKASKPPWKKHIHQEGSKKETSLASFRPCSLHDLVGPHSVSLLLLTKGGDLIERRLHQRKWKWVVHGSPKGHILTSITCINQDESNENSNALFLTTAAGFVYEYLIQKNPGSSQDQEVQKNWLNHEHPLHARAARAIAGLPLHVGRMMFLLDDGRLAELHLSGLGGESLGPNAPVSTRRKSQLKYVWSLLDAPETEGWNGEYCTEERGPTNCIIGTKDETSEVPISRWRKDSRAQHNYLMIPSVVPTSSLGQDHGILNDKFFRLRLMQGGKSFFLISDNGLMFEYLNTENAWLWLRHEYSAKMKGVLGNYNGSLFAVDEKGNLIIRERSGSDLEWINCTAMRKGKQVIAGPPWDGAPGQEPRAKPEDAIFFISRSGRLLQFTVALRKFKWKDCKTPPGMKIASIVDQEGFRDNIVFVVATNGRLFQYNKVTELWHEHYQSQHLVLSRSPGTAMRTSTVSLKGSLFMISEDGGLVEYQWSSLDGWTWIEHGTPYSNVALVGAPGPCFRGTELFLIGSDGNVHMRYLDQGEWKWRDCGYPYMEYKVEDKTGNGEICFEKIEENFQDCDPKVASTRPIPFYDDSIIFELRDGRLAEMRRMDDKNWIWSRTIGTPTSLCMSNFWTTLAS
ncbi:hypothetical protein CDL12_13989 [Handroanthus impetiginosus]|uniref:Uncharacterized protein n=1 Tax=Handroanthus impetiginosus TaxID=429701 RepID=A0A2G9H789_9LAMI|nr:hypothetical protein CDL12_13989 [Handroanthus impetiginosus]